MEQLNSPKMDNDSGSTNGSRIGQSTTVFESQYATKMDGGANMTFSDTLTNRALDDLKLKQEESLNKQNYERPFQTPVYKRYHHVHSENPTEMYIDDESQYEYFELQRQNSRSHLVNKNY
jgi:hypothetical protein